MGLGLTFKALLRTLADSRTPLKQKFAALLAFLYTISPIDLINDAIVVLGIVDDGLLLTGMLLLLRYTVPKDVYEEHEENYEENPGIGAGKIILGLLILWILTLIFALWALFQ